MLLQQSPKFEIGIQDLNFKLICIIISYSEHQYRNKKWVKYEVAYSKPIGLEKHWTVSITLCQIIFNSILVHIRNSIVNSKL